MGASHTVFSAKISVGLSTQTGLPSGPSPSLLRRQGYAAGLLFPGRRRVERSRAHADRAAPSPDFNIFALSHLMFCDGDGFFIVQAIDSRMADQMPILGEKKQAITHHG